MKLLILMLFILVFIGICVWSYYAVCKEYGFGPWAEKTSLHEFQEHKALYFNYAADYANFSEIVWCCAQAIGSSSNLMPPSEPKAIFCQRAIERVSLANGRITFAYEIPLGASGLLRREAIGPKDVQKQFADLEAAFLGRLPDYLRGGYFFRGGVSVFNAGRNCVRVEIHGVDRYVPIKQEEFVI